MITYQILMKTYNENSDEGYFIEVDIDYPKQLWSSHGVLLTVFT